MGDERPILIVDDEADLLNLVDMNLRREGFKTVTAMTGREALEAAKRDRPRLVVLDLMLPDLSGTEVCRQLRADPDLADVAIIMLSAKGEEIDRVVGFEVGADDYVVKATFSMRELVLRIRSLLRRREAKAEKEPSEEPPISYSEASIEVGTMRIDQDAHRVWVGDEEVPLTATEFKLLIVLATRSGRVQSRGTLLQDVWDMPPDLNTRTVDTHVKRLREKLGSASITIQTVRGVGYRFNTGRG